MTSRTLTDFQHEIGSRMDRGDFRGAAAAAAGCRAAWPSESAGWLLGSIAALMAENPQTALTLIDERLAMDPDDSQCWLQKAECLLSLGDRAGSLAAADAAAVHAGTLSMSLDAIGEFLFHANEYRRALAVYDRAVAAAPGDPIIRAKRADLHRALGDFDQAARDYEAVLVLSPTAPKALKGLVELRRQSADRNLVAPLQAALARAPAGSTDAAILHFGLAKSFDDLGDPARSWQHLVAGNRIERARLEYAAENDLDFIAGLIAAFPRIEMPSADTTAERPIFIVGIPRTGTTLVERILSCHSAVDAAGEIGALPEAIDVTVERTLARSAPDRVRYTDVLGRLDGAMLAAEYLARVRARRGERTRFTDKLLTNFFHCALLLRAFPNAHIVHVTRHPLAACYAIYQTRFNGTYPFAYDLTEIAEFYLGYRRLMAHWHAILPGRILDVAYEDVVTALEPTTRDLLHRVDLPFEAACLEFQRNPTPVITTSSVQVRAPLYASSLHRWKRYAEPLAPLRERLAAGGIDVDRP
jgi:tetratricopeptide (TPR) repeat protein